MLAHCEHVWTAAEVEEVPPNVAWYRLSRGASAVNSRWHVSLAAGFTAVIIAGWVTRNRIQRWMSARQAVIGPVLGIVSFIVIATGYSLARRSPHALDSPFPLVAQLLLLGLALSSAMALTLDTKRRTIVPLVSCALLASATAAQLWVTTAWQLARFPALLRQPRDLAQILTAIFAIGAIVALARVTRPRWRTGIAAAPALLLGAHLWFTALILYDGSHRASPLWRFHRPFVQQPD
jgi:hypothetical protein